MNNMIKYILGRAKEYRYSLLDLRVRILELGFKRDYSLFNACHLNYSNPIDVFLKGNIMFVTYQIGTQWYLDAFEFEGNHLHQIYEDD